MRLVRDRKRLQHPEYINSRLEVLDQDKATVVVTATLAQKAFDFVFERAGMDSDSGFRSMSLPEVA